MPINAVIEANEYAALTAVNFIRREGFTKRHQDTLKEKGVDDFGELRMVSFSYQYIGTDGRERTMTIQIPFLSMIPLPLLEVKRANFEFGLRVLDHVWTSNNVHELQQPVGQESSASTIQALLVSERNTAFQEQYNSGLIANMQVRVEIERADIPAGLLELMNLSQGASEGQSEKPFDITNHPGRVMFAPSAEQQTLKIKLASRLKRLQTAVDDVAVNLEVISNTIPVEDLFAQNIDVVEGFVIGFTTITHAKALTNTEGIVEFLFRAKPNVAGNGFFKISVNRTQELLVYFDIRKQLT